MSVTRYVASEFESIPRVVVGDDIGGSVRAKLAFVQKPDDADIEMDASRTVPEPVPATGVITQVKTSGMWAFGRWCCDRAI